MTNSNMVLCIYLVMCFSLYDLYCNSLAFSPHNHYIVEVLMAILHVYIVFAKFQTSSPKGSLDATLQ